MTAPVTTSSADSAWHTAPVTVTLTPTDAVGEVAQTKYRVDGGTWQTGTSFSVSADGDHAIQYYSEDAAGNAESAQSAQVKIDKTAPVVTMGAPLDGGAYAKDGGVTCAWTATDATSGVASEGGHARRRADRRRRRHRRARRRPAHLRRDGHRRGRQSASRDQSCIT